GESQGAARERDDEISGHEVGRGTLIGVDPFEKKQFDVRGALSIFPISGDRGPRLLPLLPATARDPRGSRPARGAENGKEEVVARGGELDDQRGGGQRHLLRRREERGGADDRERPRGSFQREEVPEAVERRREERAEGQARREKAADRPGAHR